MRIDPSQFQIETAAQPIRARGGTSLALGMGAALAWITGVCALAYYQYGVDPIPPYSTLTRDALTMTGALALGPALLILFAAHTAREAARARTQSEHLTQLAEASLALPSPAAATMAREISRSLRAELTALDGVVRAVAERMKTFERALQEDGGTLARALAEDVRTLGAVRRDLKDQADALGADVSRHVKTMRDAADLMQAETGALRTGFAAQLEAFDATSASIGARSAAFAVAASEASGSADKLDGAVTKALAALAHATSLTDSARQSAEAASEAANEAAGAVRETTRRAVADLREAAQRIRSEAHGTDEQDTHNAMRLSGLNAPENLIPRGRADIVAKPRARERTLADIVAAAGVRVSDVLSITDLDCIARAAKIGPEVRRAAVRNRAPAALKKISAYLRRNANARHEAEALRSQPAKALGDERMGRDTRRALSSAYLLIDAVLS